MLQGGKVGSKTVRAWAFGAIAGYSVQDPLVLSPRFAFQLDTASGNKNPTSDTLGTFNPLFPNGYYVTLASLPGYSNFIQAKPSITFRPGKSLSVQIAGAGVWRMSTADAVYMLPAVPVANTAGRAGIYTGTYGELRVDWNANAHTKLALEAEHFVISDRLRAAGMKSGNYLGIESQIGF